MTLAARSLFIAFGCLLTVALCTARKPRGHYLYVWAGCNNGTSCKDYLATVNLIPSSPKYGQVVKKTFIPYGGTEAHHCGFYNNNKMIAAGALFDFIFKTPSVFMFDLKNPASPKYVKSGTSISGSAADDIDVIPKKYGGGFLLTMMGSKNGTTPGRVSRYSSKGRLVAEYPPTDDFESSATFNPHGLAVSEKWGVFGTADFFEPASAATDTVLFRNTVRLWDLKTFKMLKTFTGQAQGFMDMKFLGDRPYAFTGNGLGDAWLMDVKNRTFQKVFTLPDRLKPTFTCIMRPYNNGRRIVASIWASHSITIINIDDAYNPFVIDSITLPKEANPHGTYLVETDEGILVVIASYFVNRPGVVKVSLPGDSSVRFFLIKNDKIMEHPVLKPIYFGRDHGGNPHDVRMLPVY